MRVYFLFLYSWSLLPCHNEISLFLAIANELLSFAACLTLLKLLWMSKIFTLKIFLKLLLWIWISLLLLLGKRFCLPALSSLFSICLFLCQNFNVVNPNIARFIRSEEDDMNPSWEQRLVKRYYDKLFKEYPLQTCSIFILILFIL